MPSWLSSLLSDLQGTAGYGGGSAGQVLSTESGVSCFIVRIAVIRLRVSERYRVRITIVVSIVIVKMEIIETKIAIVMRITMAILIVVVIKKF